MIKIIVLLIFVLTALLQAEMGLEYYAGVHTQYMWRGYDLGSDKAMVTPGLTLSLGDNIWFDIWTGLNADYKELDLTAAYYLEPSDAFGVDLGVIVYSYPGMEDYETSYEPFLTFYSYSLPFEPVVTAAYDVVVEAYYFDLAGSLTLMEESLALNVGFGAGVFGWEGFTGLSNIRFELGKDFELAGFTITPNLQYHVIPQSFIDENADPGMESGEFVFSVNFSGGGGEE